MTGRRVVVTSGAGLLGSFVVEGPHLTAIYDRVLLRALREAAPALWEPKDRLEAENRDLRLQLAGLRNSRSWRMTAPLRRLSRRVWGLRH